MHRYTLSLRSKALYMRMYFVAEVFESVLFGYAATFRVCDASLNPTNVAEKYIANLYNGRSFFQSIVQIRYAATFGMCVFNAATFRVCAYRCAAQSHLRICITVKLLNERKYTATFRVRM